MMSRLDLYIIGMNDGYVMGFRSARMANSYFVKSRAGGCE